LLHCAVTSCREKHYVNPFRCIDQAVSASRPDLIIADFLTFGAFDVAEKHKVSQSCGCCLHLETHAGRVFGLTEKDPSRSQQSCCCACMLPTDPTGHCCDMPCQCCSQLPRCFQPVERLQDTCRRYVRLVNLRICTVTDGRCTLCQGLWAYSYNSPQQQRQPNTKHRLCG
jgi:hypothetical protein